jgi:hypothetical protein
MRKLLRTIVFFILTFVLLLGLSVLASLWKIGPSATSARPEQPDTTTSSLDKSVVRRVAVWQYDYGVSKDAPYSVRIEVTLNDAYFNRGATGTIRLYGANGVTILKGPIEEHGTASFCGPGTMTDEAREYFNMDAVDTNVRLDDDEPLHADILVNDKSGNYEIKQVQASLLLAAR